MTQKLGGSRLVVEHTCGFAMSASLLRNIALLSGTQAVIVECHFLMNVQQRLFLPLSLHSDCDTGSETCRSNSFA
jgi:hypothetical protein